MDLENEIDDGKEHMKEQAERATMTLRINLKGKLEQLWECYECYGSIWNLDSKEWRPISVQQAEEDFYGC